MFEVPESTVRVVSGQFQCDWDPAFISSVEQFSEPVLPLWSLVIKTEVKADLYFYSFTARLLSLLRGIFRH